METESDQHCDGNVVDDLPLNDDRLEVGDIDDQESIAEDQLRKDELESRLAGSSPGSGSVDSQESLTREEKLLEEMLRLKLVGSGTGASNSMLPPKQRIKLYQPRSKLEQFEDILLESQLRTCLQFSSDSKCFRFRVESTYEGFLKIPQIFFCKYFSSSIVLFFYFQILLFFILAS